MRVLQQGAQGDDVKAWQQALGIEADGFFGSQTFVATRNFQREHGLGVDGIVGPSTWAAVSAKPPPAEEWQRWPAQAECDDYYGDPRGSNGASPKWESSNIVRVVPPWRMIDEDSKRPISGISIHRKCAASLTRILNKAWELYGKSQAEIDKRGLNVFSGSYVFRNIRGSSRLSMHAYGCALDIASQLNELGKPYDPKRGLPMEFVKLFEDEGWTWGGRWTGRPDAMHFQAAYVSRSDVPARPPKPTPQMPAGADTGRAVETGPSALEEGKGSWYSQYKGKYRWGDNEDEPNSNALGVPDDCQGISFLNHDTLGKWFELHAPNGNISIEQQTEIGPALWTGRKIDISAVCAERMGYSPETFPTDAPWKWRQVPAPDAVKNLPAREQAKAFKRLRTAPSA